MRSEPQQQRWMLQGLAEWASWLVGGTNFFDSENILSFNNIVINKRILLKFQVDKHWRWFTITLFRMLLILSIILHQHKRQQNHQTFFRECELNEPFPYLHFSRLSYLREATQPAQLWWRHQYTTTMTTDCQVFELKAPAATNYLMMEEKIKEVRRIKWLYNLYNLHELVSLFKCL